LCIRKFANLTQSTHRIAIVDDCDAIRQTFRAVLQHAGLNVAEYASGREFLNNGISQRPDCILLDLEMPDINGIEVLAELQNSNCATPVLVITGTQNPALLEAARQSNISAVLQKPIGKDALLAAVAQAVSGSLHNG
jgi:CheY-like chemotaxis protein